MALGLAALVGAGVMPVVARAGASGSSMAAAKSDKSTQADMDARRKALFSKMMADPSNAQLALKYAALASKAGDLEGAISTLERVAIFAPDLARVKLDLGVLYYRLKSYQLAQVYFEDATHAKHAPSGVKAVAKRYLAALRQMGKPAN